MLIIGNSTALSQVTITDNQAKDIIKDKRELESLKSVVANWELLTKTQEKKIKTLEGVNREQRLIVDLHSENYSDCLKRVSIVEDKKTPVIIRILQGLGVFAVGYLVGSVM